MKLILSIILLVFVSTTTAQAEDPTRIHKDDYMSFCISKRDSEDYCKCTMKAVEADIEKRKARFEKMIANDKLKASKSYKSSVAMIIKKRFAESEDEILADCEIVKAYKDGKVTEAKYNETFADRKAGFYKHRLEKKVCNLQATESSETEKLYESKDYEHINASYIMNADNECHRKYLTAQ